MNVQDVFSGAWGQSAFISILGAFLVFFVKRSLVKHDAHVTNQYKEIANMKKEQLKRHDEIREDINEIRVNLGIVSTQVQGLTKALDKINMNGCNKCRAAHSKSD